MANLITIFLGSNAHMHDERLFINVDEMRTLLRLTGFFEEPLLEPAELRGMGPAPNFFGPGGFIQFQETESTNSTWLGWARKKGERSGEEVESVEELIGRIKAFEATAAAGHAR